ncbi:putative endo-polygalacturonase [Helianthus debilis subsp. tardiflorus]
MPRSIANLQSLMHLDLRNNLISGTIPINFGKLWMLNRALLSRNRIYSQIPYTISYIRRLLHLV